MPRYRITLSSGSKVDVVSDIPPTEEMVSGIEGQISRKLRKKDLLKESASNLSAIEDPVGWFGGASENIKEVGGQTLQGALTMPEGVLSLAGRSAEAVNRWTGGDPEAESMFTTGARKVREFSESLPGSDAEGVAAGFNRGIGQMGSALVGGAGARVAGATRATAASMAAGSMFGAEFQDAFDRSVQRGDSPDVALAKSLGYASVSTMIENMAGAGRVFRKLFPAAEEGAKALTKLGVAKEVAKNFAYGYGEEGSQRFMQNLIVAPEEGLLTGVNEEAIIGALVQGPVATIGLRGENGKTVRLKSLPELTKEQTNPSALREPTTGGSATGITLDGQSVTLDIETGESVAEAAAKKGLNADELLITDVGLREAVPSTDEMTLVDAARITGQRPAREVTPNAEEEVPQGQAQVTDLGTTAPAPATEPAIEAGEVQPPPLPPSQVPEQAEAQGNLPTEGEAAATPSQPSISQATTQEQESKEQTISPAPTARTVTRVKRGEPTGAGVSPAKTKPAKSKRAKQEKTELEKNNEIAASILPKLKAVSTKRGWPEGKIRVTRKDIDKALGDRMPFEALKTGLLKVEAQDMGDGTYHIHDRTGPEYAPAPAPQPAAPEKEDWEKTQNEYVKENTPKRLLRDKNQFSLLAKVESGQRVGHRNAVEQALREGKPVPAAVLADYPDLAPTAPAPAAAPTQAEDSRARIREKQDRAIEIATRKGLPEDVPISDIQVGAPTISELRSLIFPEFEDSIDSFLDDNKTPDAPTEPSAATALRDAAAALTKAAEAMTPKPAEQAQTPKERADEGMGWRVRHGDRNVTSFETKSEADAFSSNIGGQSPVYERMPKGASWTKNTVKPAQPAPAEGQAGEDALNTSETKAVAKEEAKAEKPVAQQKAPFDAKAAKAQKKFLLAEVEKAIEEAPETRSMVPADADIEELRSASSWNRDDTQKTFNARREEVVRRFADKYGLKWPKKSESPTDMLVDAMFDRLLGRASTRTSDGISGAVEQAIFEQSDKVTIEVPGDGTFSIINSKVALRDFKERASKFPTTAAKESKPSTPRTEPTSAGPVGKLDAENTVKAAALSASTEPNRKIINYLWSDGKRTVATDGRRLIVVNKGLGGTEKTPKLFTVDGKPANPEGNYPNWSQVVPVTEPLITTSEVDTARMFSLVKQAQEVTTDKNISVKLWFNPDGSVGVSSASEEGSYESNTQEGATASAFNPDYLLDAFRAARRVGDEKVRFEVIDELTPLVITSKSTKTVIMPMRMNMLAEAGAQPNGISPSAVEAQLGELGIQTGGSVTVVDNPNWQSKGAMEYDTKTGKPIRIVFNAAYIQDKADVAKVWEHETAHWTNAEGVLDNLYGFLTRAEKDSIESAVGRLGYRPEQSTREILDRGVEQLVKAWRGRTWFGRMVAKIRAWLRSKGWVELGRREAELIAARAVAQTTQALRNRSVIEQLATLPEAVEFAGGVLVPPYQTKAAQSIVAYHGTPHNVDRFTTAKIGTGEGAQVYGWGLYFAENKEVAESYKKALSNIANGAANWNTLQELAHGLIYTAGGNRAEAKNLANTKLRQTRLKAYQDVLQLIDTIEYNPNTGNTYTVRLNVEPDDLLDWDKPLGEQSEKVRNAVEPYMKQAIEDASRRDSGWGDLSDPSKVQSMVTGSSLYRIIKESQHERLSNSDWIKVGRNREKAAADMLAKNGIRGIRYLDQGSRGSGKWVAKYPDGILSAQAFDTKEAAEAYIRKQENRGGIKGLVAVIKPESRTYNYVIFDENDIEITHKNGERVTPAQASATQAMQERSTDIREMLADQSDRRQVAGMSGVGAELGEAKQDQKAAKAILRAKYDFQLSTMEGQHEMLTKMEDPDQLGILLSEAGAEVRKQLPNIPNDVVRSMLARMISDASTHEDPLWWEQVNRRYHIAGNSTPIAQALAAFGQKDDIGSAMATIAEAREKNARKALDLEGGDWDDIWKQLKNEMDRLHVTPEELTERFGKIKLGKAGGDKLVMWIARKKAEANKTPKQQAKDDAQQDEKDELSWQDKTAQSISDRFEKANTEVLLQKQVNAVKEIVKGEIQSKEAPPFDEGGEEGTRNIDQYLAGVAAKLEKAGVSPNEASRLAQNIHEARKSRWASRRKRAEDRKLARATDKVSDIVNYIGRELVKTPLMAQDAQWRQDIATKWFEDFGLEHDRAVEAAKAFDALFERLETPARAAAAEKILAPKKKREPRKIDEFDRTMNRLRAQIRIGLLEKDQDWQTNFAEAEGWNKLTKEEAKQLRENVEALENALPHHQARLRSRITKTLQKHTDPNIAHEIASFYSSDQLGGIGTQALSLLNPGVDAMIRMSVDVMSSIVQGDFTRARVSIRAFAENVKKWGKEYRHAFKHDAYTEQILTSIEKISNLYNLNERGWRKWEDKSLPAYQRAYGLLQAMSSWVDIVRQNMSSLDQAWQGTIRPWQTALAGYDVMRKAGAKPEDAAAMVFASYDKTGKYYEQEIARGLGPLEAEMEAKDKVRVDMMNAIAQGTGEGAVGTDSQAALEADLAGQLEAQYTTGNHPGEGTVFGVLHRLLSAIQNAVNDNKLPLPILYRFIAGFPKVNLNIVGRSMAYTPWGFVRAVIDYRQRKKGKPLKDRFYRQSFATEVQRRQRIREAVVGTIALATIAAMWLKDRDKPDEEKDIWFDFVGPTEKKRRAAWLRAGHRPGTIGIKVGNKRVNINIMRGGLENFQVPLAAIGAYEDTMRMGKDGGSVIEAIYHTAALTGMPGTDTRPFSGEAGLMRSAVSKLGGFVPFSGLLRSVNKVVGPQEPGDAMEYLFAYMPVTPLFLNKPALNFMGEPIHGITSYTAQKLGLPVTVSKPDQVYADMARLNTWPEMTSRDTVEKRMKRAISDDEWYSFMRTYGQSLGQDIRRTHEDWKDDKPAVIAKRFGYYKQKAETAAYRAIR